MTSDKDDAGYYPADAPPPNPNKPWRVTAHHFVRCRLVKCFVIGDYKHYWQANLKSWWWSFMGWGCNTWRLNGEEKDPR